MHSDDPKNDPLDDALAEAFTKDAVRPPAPSVISALQARVKSALGVHIDSIAPDDVPVRVTDEAKALRDPTGRYHILGEVGRGGVGIVYKGRDQDLGRDVAMKVLKDEYAHHSEVLARFVEEAQIGGQLQHPGIVPVYELGLHTGERPYFAMKLVKGETLSAQLTRRSDPGVDRRKFFGVFEQICQTMAYAHSRHVVHRDLKPANVMIGAFGEVQIVDWGMGKVLQTGGVDDEQRATDLHAQVSVIATVRSSGPGSHSIVGSVMGTPAYMPPEQARGEVEQMDERSDVFALGAILCEILTGLPPYVGRQDRLLTMAAGANLDGAVARLAECGAEDTLVELCRECLAPARMARPASAQDVAQRVSAYLTSIEERARAAELDAVQARYHQRTTLLSAAAVMAILVIGGIAWSWIAAEARQHKQAATDRIAVATSDVRAAHARAQAARFDLELWATATKNAERLGTLARDEDVEDEVRRRANTLLATIDNEHQTAAAEIARRDRDREMQERLITARIPTDDDIRSAGFEANERQRLDDAYRAAFGFYLGKPIGDVTTEEALASMRKGGIEVELAASLDHLCMVRDQLADQPGISALTARLREIATLLDPGDAWRTQLRTLLPNATPSAERLRGLANTVDFTKLTATHCLVLSMALWQAAAAEDAVRVLRLGREQFPQDFSLTFELAARQERLGVADWQAIVATLDVARAIAPGQNEVLHRQGMALEQLGRHRAAERVFRILVERNGSNAHWLRHVGSALQNQGKLDEAIVCFRRAIQVDPTYAPALGKLGKALVQQGRFDEAIASFHRAIAIAPRYADAYSDLGNALYSQGKLDEAIASFNKAVGIDPRHGPALSNLGTALLDQGKVDDAIAYCRKAIEADPRFAKAHSNLGNALRAQGKLDEAIASYEQAIAADPSLAPAHSNLGATLVAQGKLDEAIASYERALELDPKSALTHFHRALILHQQGQMDAAIGGYYQAIEADPKYANAYNNLGVALNTLGRVDEAIEVCHQAVDADPNSGPAHYSLGAALEAHGSLDAAIASYKQALAIWSPRSDAFSVEWAGRSESAIEELAPRLRATSRMLAIVRGEADAASPPEWFTAADLAYQQKDYIGSAQTYSRGFAAFPESSRAAGHAYNAACSAALAASGQGKDAAGLTSIEKAELRAQALGWLAIDLERWAMDKSATTEKTALAVRTLQHWQRDSDLAPIRGDQTLASLPVEEAAKWSALWRDVAKTLKQWEEVK